MSWFHHRWVNLFFLSFFFLVEHVLFQVAYVLLFLLNHCTILFLGRECNHTPTQHTVLCVYFCVFSYEEAKNVFNNFCL